MKQILIIDDEPQVLRMLRKLFEEAGYGVRVAADGEAGIKTYRETPADIIITDIVMPDKEGLGMIRELKRDFPEVKIIAMSGGGKNRPDGYLTMAKEFGALRTFQKPIDVRELLDAVRELLS